MLMQEMIQRSYIKYHPTSGYKTATPEIKRVYDGFEVYNYHEERNPRRAVTTNIKDEDWKPMGLTQLLGISLHYAPTFSNMIDLTTFDNKDGKKNKYDNMSTFYRIPSYSSSTSYYLRKLLDMWLKLGKLPASYMENSADARHAY
eukprot:2103708-Amphidinium_carterae.1